MKGNDWILIGFILIAVSSVFSLQIVDPSKPEILVFPGSMHPEGQGSYSEISYIYVLVRDQQSQINSVQWSFWQTGEPSKFYDLAHSGTASFNYSGNNEFLFNWGRIWPDPDFPNMWDIWAVNISSNPINEPGQYIFWFHVYNGAGKHNEPSNMPNKFSITLSALPEEPPPDLDSDTAQIPESPEPTSAFAEPYLMPVILFLIGGMSIVYGFSRKKKKVQP